MEIVESTKADNVNKLTKPHPIIFKIYLKMNLLIQIFEKFSDLYIFYNPFIFTNIINILQFDYTITYLLLSRNLKFYKLFQIK